MAPARAQSVDDAEDEAATGRATGRSGHRARGRCRRPALQASKRSWRQPWPDQRARRRVVTGVGGGRAAQGAGGLCRRRVGRGPRRHRDRAVDAYMTALSSPGVNFVNSDDVEDVMVTGLFVADVISAGQADRSIHSIIKRDDLEDLDCHIPGRAGPGRRAQGPGRHRGREPRRRSTRRQTPAVAEAIREADRSAAEYSEALSAVDSARAREAEQERQERARTAGHHRLPTRQ